jgi:diguanylate cyclase (GGDEF)-like protein/PAS domain S-box-containing protein
MASRAQLDQWRARHDALTAALTMQQARAGAEGAPLIELRAATAALPPLFDRLQQLGDAQDSFAERRRAALVDQLLTTTQAMSDHAFQWSIDAEAERTRVSRDFRVIALGAPLAMLAVLAGLAWVVHRRALVPLAALERGAIAVRDGRLDHRVASTARDEIGELSRQFDAMTAALAEGREKLSRSERQLRDITDNLPVLLGYVDADQVYRFANAQYRTMFGIEPGAIVGLTMAELLGPERYAGVREEVEAALRGERRSFERRSLIGERSRYLQLQYIADVEPDGRVPGFYVMITDITERKLAELARERSEKRLTDLMNSIPAMVGWFDMDERCQYANDAGLKSLGLERSEVPGISLRAALGESNYAQHAPYVREALQGRRARLNGKIPFEGRTAYFQAHLIPDHGEGGTQRGFFLMTFDVTALQEAQLRQAQMEGRMRAISDNLPVLIAYVDAEQRYGFMNRTYKDWFGVDPEQVIGRPVAEVLGPGLYGERRAALERALTGERVAFEVESDALGTRRILQSVYIPDIRPDGQVAGVYALATDVSAPKAIERELARLARSDALTGLPNRLLFEELMPQALARARRAGSAVALMFLDIDHFKSINDTHGHAGGDAVLCEFANRLKHAVRLTDTVARLAGDEFVIALEGLHHAREAEAIARNVLAQVRRPFRVLGIEMAVTTSIGVAFHGTGTGPTTPDELLARADEALYAAKLAGRNGFHLAREGASVMGSLA